jgi:hypothetical protein
VFSYFHLTSDIMSDSEDDPGHVSPFPHEVNDEVLDLTGPLSSQPKSSQPRFSTPKSFQSSSSQPKFSTPKSSRSESNRLFESYRISDDDDNDFESDIPSCNSIPSNKEGRTYIIHRNKRIELKPLTEEEVKSDQRYHLRTMFKLKVIEENGEKYYQCLLCLPTFKLMWTSKTTYQHLEKHVQAVHKTYLPRYRALAATRTSHKRKRSSSPSQSSSQIQPSVSKRFKFGSAGATPVQWSFYSQADFLEDTITEVVMNMLPFEVIGFLIIY